MEHGLTDAGAGRKPSDSAKSTYKCALALPRLIVAFAAVEAAAMNFVVAFGLLLATMLDHSATRGVGMLLTSLTSLPIALRINH